MRVALVHDWLLGMRGGERCLEVLCDMFPEADIYTLFYSQNDISEKITLHQPSVSVLGRLPRVRNYYRLLLPFYDRGIRDLSNQLKKNGPYDLVISVSHCVAKNISLHPSTYHLCYCLTPMRYLYDQYDAYFGDHLLEPFIRKITNSLRTWDQERSRSVSHFVAISEFISSRINKYYERPSTVIYPPVSTHWISPRSENEQGEGFLAVNALVPYKNVDLIVKTFSILGLPLTIIGSGPEMRNLKKIATKNITFIQHLSDRELGFYYRRSKALIFASIEDFGMTPVEMQAAGRPVIAFGKGGAKETVSDLIGSHSGVFFSELSTESLSSAVRYFLDHEAQFTVDNCLKQANRFSVERFQESFWQVLEQLGIEDVKKTRTGF